MAYLGELAVDLNLKEPAVCGKRDEASGCPIWVRTSNTKMFYAGVSTTTKITSKTM